jgi:hypothetical protein
MYAMPTLSYVPMLRIVMRFHPQSALMINLYTATMASQWRLARW